MSTPLITASLVTYHTPISQLHDAIKSVLNTCLPVHLIIIDNSRVSLQQSIPNDSRITYIFNNQNVGFGKAHNQGIAIALEKKSSAHLILNPDISFNTGVMEALFDYLAKNPKVGLLMPKVLYPDGAIQYLCKKLPTVLDLVLRRFAMGFIQNFFRARMDQYEMKQADYDKIMQVPYLSGCFMFIRTEALNKVGGFDERFFMYFEDTDLCRRIGQHYQTVYFPEVSVCHHYGKGSYKKLNLLWIHIKSAIAYFNKWGWQLW